MAFGERWKWHFYPQTRWYTDYPYWVAVGEPRRKVAKLRNGYPEDIAGV